MLLKLKEILRNRKRIGFCFRKKKEKELKEKQKYRYILVNTDQIISVEPTEYGSYISSRTHQLLSNRSCWTYFEVIETVDDIYEMSKEK